MGKTDPERSLSRRNFLAGTAAGALAGGLPIPALANVGGGDGMKAVLIGCGGRGNGAVGNYLKNENVKIIAVADLFRKKAEAAANRWKISPDMTFSGFDAYRKAIATDCNYVILATPPGFRPIHYAAAIEAGKNVFMEKPCCVDAPGFNMLQEANRLADDRNLKVGVGLQRRHEPAYINRMKEIHDGKFGEMVLLRAYWNGGGVWTRKREENMSEMEFQCNNWYYFNWLCGDNICEQHVHNLDICNWAKGEHPVEANGMGGRLRRTPGSQGQIFDEHFVEFTYSDGSRMYSQCRHIRGCWNSVSEHFHGTRGSGSCKGEGKGRNSKDQEHTDLIEAIRGNRKYNEGWYGATSSMTAVLGRMATYSGKVVKWSDAVARGPAEMIYENPDKLTFESNPPVMPDENGEYPVAVPGVYKPY